MGRGTVMAKTVYSVIPKKIYGVIPKSVYNVDMAADAELSVYITSYYVSSWTQAIQDACAALKTIGGGTIIFPAGDYLIKPLLINVSGNNITFKGVGTVRLYTTETVLWNYCIMVTGDNVIFNNLTFDHRGDSALLPTTDPYKGAISIWFNGSDYSTTRDCTFYTYAIVCVLCDNYNGLAANQFDFYNNHQYFQRKVDSWYDVSNVNLQARTIHYYNNVSNSVQTAFTTWKARSGAELHFAKGYATNNSFDGSQVGILYEPWGSDYSGDYDPLFGADVLINLNTVTKAVIGIELWTGMGGADRTFRNVTIQDNTLGLYFENKAYCKPTGGILFYKGGAYDTEIQDISIHDNAINFTYNASDYANLAAVRGAYYLAVYGEDTGAFCLNIANTMRRISIHDNTVSQFPYSLLNLYRRSGSETVVHEDIEFYNHTVTNSCYAEPFTHSPYPSCKACFTLGYSDTVSITGNAISNAGIALQAQKEELAYLTNLTYTGNTFT